MRLESLQDPQVSSGNLSVVVVINTSLLRGVCIVILHLGSINRPFN